MDRPRQPVTFRARDFDPALHRHLLDAGLGDTAARIAAARLPADHPDPVSLVRPSLGDLQPPDLLYGIDRACDRLVSALLTRETICCCVDHDADGITSLAILDSAITGAFGHPKERFIPFTTHRLEEGYGLSEKACDRILSLSPRPSLVLTADQGIADEDRIARLANDGIDVIVTDHHTIPDAGPPASAYAVINPQLPQCGYDPHATGGVVAFLLVAHLRRRLMEIGALPPDAPSLAPLLDFAAISAVADCVSLGASANNRAIVRAGLARINTGTRPCWRALLALLGSRGPVTEETIAFQIAPRLAASGRLDAAMPGVRFLLSGDDTEAHRLLELLSRDNEARKAIQADMVHACMRLAKEQAADGQCLLVLFDESFHQGICGIACSRIGEAFGLPGIVLAPAWGASDLLSGSGRAIRDGVNMIVLLDRIRTQAPDLLVAGGGHAAACGLKIRRKDLPAFTRVAQAAALEAFGPPPTGRIVLTDGGIEPERIDAALLGELDTLRPFGKGFPAPIFEISARVKQARRVGDGSHLKLALQAGQRIFPAIWFSALEPGAPLPVMDGEWRQFAFRPSVNSYRGSVSIQLEVTALQD